MKKQCNINHLSKMVSCRLKRLSKSSISNFRISVKNINIDDDIAYQYAKFLLRKKKFLRLGIFLQEKEKIILDFNTMFSFGDISNVEYIRFFEKNQDPFSRNLLYTLEQLSIIFNDCKYQNDELTLGRIFQSLKMEDRVYKYSDFEFIFSKGFTFSETDFYNVIGYEKHRLSNIIIEYAYNNDYKVSNFSRKVFLKELRLEKDTRTFTTTDLDHIFDLCQFNIEELFTIMTRYFNCFVGNVCDTIIIQTIVNWSYSNHEEVVNSNDYFFDDDFYLDNFIEQASKRFCTKSVMKVASMLHKTGYNSKIINSNFKEARETSISKTVFLALIFPVTAIILSYI